MSNIIPIVSSSPPPLDDGGAGWDEDNDDDEFGNFASAPSVGPTEITSISSFDVNWSKSDLSLPEDGCRNEKSEESRSYEDITFPRKLPLNVEWVNNNSKMTNSSEENEFPDFTHFNGDAEADCDQPAKMDCVTSAVETNELSEVDTDVSACKEASISNQHPSSDSVSTDQDSFSFAVSKNNESLYSTSSTIDSGVFSTDLSPSSQGTFTSDLYQSTEAANLEKPVATFKTLSGNLPKDDKSQVALHSDSLHSSHDENDPPITNQADMGEDWSDFNSALDQETISACVDETETNSANSESGDPRNGNCSESGENSLHSQAITNVTEFKDFINIAGEMENVFQSSSVPFEDSLGDQSNVRALRICDEEKPADQDHKVTSFQDSPLVAQVDTESSQNGQPINVEERYIEMVNDSQENDSEWGDFDNVHSNDENKDIENNDSDKKSQGTEVDVLLDKENVKPSPIMSDLQNSTIQNESETDEMADHDENFISEDHCIKNKNVSTINELSSNIPNTAEDYDTRPCTNNELKDNNLEDKEEEDTEFGQFVSLPKEELPPITFRTSVCETEEPESDFGFDQGKSLAFNNDDDDDFGAFGEANIDDHGEFDSATQPANNTQVSTFENDEDNDFGDFGTTDQNQEGEASWADFGEAAPLTAEKEPCGSGDADIKTYSIPSSKVAEQIQSKAQKLERAVVSCFPETVEQTPKNGISNHGSRRNSLTDASNTTLDESDNLTPLEIVVELGLTNPLEAKQQTWTVVQHPAKKDPKVRLWNNLKDVDSSHALVYSWPASHCSKEVYGTLHIDTQNVLFSQKKQAVPFFASGLILEPIRGGENKINKHIQSPAGLLDSNRQEQRQTVSTVQDIPPVDFDWSSSGLTNPLTANTLDLDFLVVQGSDSYEKASDEWDWVFKADCQESTRSSLQPLEDILKKSTPTVKLATHEVLSPEALRILEKMPDLSFMQSRVLMFPVKQ